MPITRGIEVILSDMDEMLELYNDEWERLQTKKRKHPRLKTAMDAIALDITRLRKQRGALAALRDKTSGQRCHILQRMKHMIESKLQDMRESLEAISQM